MLFGFPKRCDLAVYTLSWLLLLVSQGVFSQPPASGVAVPTPQQLQQAHRYGDQFRGAWRPVLPHTVPLMAIPEAYTRPSNKPRQSSNQAATWPQPYYDFCYRFPMAWECRGFRPYPYYTPFYPHPRME